MHETCLNTPESEVVDTVGFAGKRFKNVTVTYTAQLKANSDRRWRKYAKVAPKCLKYKHLLHSHFAFIECSFDASRATPIIMKEMSRSSQCLKMAVFTRVTLENFGKDKTHFVYFLSQTLNFRTMKQRSDALNIREEFLKIVEYFTLENCLEHPERYLILFVLWATAMVYQYFLLSLRYDKKYHRPFLGQTHEFEGMKHKFTNEYKSEEIRLSVQSNLLFAFVYALITPLAASEYGMMYVSFDKYGYPYLIASFFILVLLHDMYQYWTHRLAHEWKWYFKKVHGVHHKFLHPTPYSSWAMHPVDALVNASFVMLIVFFIPVHPLVYALYIHYASKINSIGHIYKQENESKGVYKFLDKYIGDSRMHIVHHKLVHINYFFVTKFWDRQFKTIKESSTPQKEIDNASDTTLPKAS